MREALLIANSVAYSETSKNVPRATVRSVVDELEANFSNLTDEYAFGVKKAVDETASRAREIIRQFIKRCGRTDSFTLIYYFGHAIKPPHEEELYLYFRDSEVDDPGTMIAFSDIARWLTQYRVDSVVLMLDCCYAGTVATKMRLLDVVAANYYVMASVNPKEKALVDYGGERAYGLFSNAILQAFKSPESRAGARTVTFKSFFKAASEGMRKTSQQQPYSADSNLADHTFFVQTSRPIIVPSFRESAPKKSIYRKLFVIGNELLRHGEQSEKFLYASLKRRQQDEFLQPQKIGNRITKYEFVSHEAFRRYIRLAVLLGMIEDRDILSLTGKGREMIARKGHQFNIALFELIEAVWADHGFKLVDFEDAIYKRLQGGSAPSLGGIYRDVSLSRPLTMSKDRFKVLFDLTGYCGGLSYSADKTFFPPVTDVRFIHSTE